MDTNDFIEKITGTVREFIEGEECYGDDAQLEINTVTWQTDVADPEQDLPDCDYYPVMDLVRMSVSEPGKWEPDEDAIAGVAAEYIFTE